VPADVGLLGELSPGGELGQGVVELPARERDQRRLVVIDRKRVGDPEGLGRAPAALDRRRRLVQPVQTREHQPADHVRARVLRFA
jgi:hypothetical protein